MPDLPARLVGRADAIPEHVRDDRRAAVGMTTTARPLARRELRDLRRGGGLVARATPAMRRRSQERLGRESSAGTMVLDGSDARHGEPLAARVNARKRYASLPTGRSRMFGNLPARPLSDMPPPYGCDERRRLIAGRRLRQRVACRLAGELRLLVQMRAHQGVPVEDARLAELARAHRPADVGFLDRACSRRVVVTRPARGLVPRRSSSGLSAESLARALRPLRGRSSCLRP